MKSTDKLPLVYLAGPGVFREDSLDHGRWLADLCMQYGLKGMYPLDNIVSGEGKELAENIFEANVKLLLRANAVLVDMEPFRGSGMDGGTSWEMGFAYARNLPMVGYTSNQLSYLERTKDIYLLSQDSKDIWRDEKCMAVEDFGLVDNLMMACSARKSSKIIYSDPESAIQALAKILSTSTNT